MPLGTLEEIRLLSNLETRTDKLLQIVLFGQPELDDKLSSGSIRQLRQRITFQHDLSGMDEREVGAYFAHRMSVAGYGGRPLFTKAARKVMFRASRWVPRLVNILSNKALLLLYGEGGGRIDARHVRSAALDTPAAVQQPRWWQWPGLLVSRTAK